MRYLSHSILSLIIIGLSHSAHAGSNPFIPDFPYKTATVVMEETEAKDNAYKRTFYMQGNTTRVDTIIRNEPGSTYTLYTPTAQIDVNTATKTYTVWRRIEAIMNDAYTALPADKQATLRTNLAALGPHIPMDVVGDAVEHPDGRDSDILNYPAHWYQNEDNAALGCWYRNTIYDAGYSMSGASYTKDTISITTDQPLDAALFTIPADYTRKEGNPGTEAVNTKRYTTLVTLLAEPGFSLKSAHYYWLR